MSQRRGARGRRAFLSMLAGGVVWPRFSRGDEPSASAASLIGPALAALHSPGAAGALVLGGSTVFAATYGTRTLGRESPVASETRFRIASITKVVTGMALLRLRDDGKLTLDDSIAKYVPEAARVVGPNGKPVDIKLRHLVTHTSGLPRSVPNAITAAGLRALLAQTRTLHAPGTHTAYSNFAAGLVGLLIANVSGIPYRDYVKQKITGPLGMTDVAWSMHDIPREYLATGHEWKSDANGRVSLVPATAEWNMGAAEAFGGLYASLSDMQKLITFQLSAYGDGPESPVLQRSTIIESHTQQTTGQPEPAHHGVYWWLGDGLVWHSGATDEYSGSVVLWPKKRAGAVILMNHANVAGVERATKRLLRAALGG